MRYNLFMSEEKTSRKYLLKRSIKRATLSRIMAKGIDLFIVLLLSVFFYPLGVMLSAAYLGIADSLQNGQSVGKKFMGFAVISLEDGKPCTLKQSVIRNLPFLIPTLFAVIPIWGWIFSFITGVVFMVFELYLLFKLDSGHRIGDVMADTSVMANDGSHVAIKNRKSSWFESTGSQASP